MSAVTLLDGIGLSWTGHIGGQVAAATEDHHVGTRYSAAEVDKA
jgi:hypothetical protein